MFDQIETIKKVAEVNSINPSALCAVVEIESNGKPFEDDGVTPCFLFERHIFYRELSKLKPQKLQSAIDGGLAIPKWSRTTQYKDQGGSKGRLALLIRARFVDEECANRSCSWGLGQTMGFLCKELGYPTATLMVKDMSSVDVQLQCMVKEIKNKNLIEALNTQDWPKFAKGYNGAAYKQNQYDTRLAKSFICWEAKLNNQDPEEIPLARVPVQNAEPSKMDAAKSPEAIATYVASGSGILGSLSGIDGPLGYSLAIVIVIAALIGGFFLFRRIRSNP